MKVRTYIQVESWPIGRLIPRITNPRTHTPQQIDQIAASLEEFGWTNPILVGADDNIIAGHGRLLAARQLQMKHVPVIVLKHLNEAQCQALVIAANQLALNSGWDEEKLQLELAALQNAGFNLDLLAIDEKEVARMLAEVQRAVRRAHPEALLEVPNCAICLPADLWMLGNHRLLVGDATDRDAVGRLMAGEVADMVFTAPPCTVDSEEPEQSGRSLATMFSIYRQIVKPSAPLYVCHPPSRQREFQNALEAAGFEVDCQIVWVNVSGKGDGRNKLRHEPLFCAHVAGEKNAWYGDKWQSTVWEEQEPEPNRLYATMKPVELVDRALMNSSKLGDICTDLFGGLGSTLIACEYRGRKHPPPSGRVCPSTSWRAARRRWTHRSPSVVTTKAITNCRFARLSQQD